MDALGVINCNNPDDTPKDQRPLHNQRSVIMNSKICCAAYQERKTRKQAAEAEKAARVNQANNRKAHLAAMTDQEREQYNKDKAREYRQRSKEKKAEEKRRKDAEQAANALGQMVEGQQMDTTA